MNTKIVVKVVATPTRALDEQTVSAPVNKTYTFEWDDGTGADQANQVFTDERTLGASASEDLDLAASLTNAFGQTLTFTIVKAIVVAAAAGNTNNVLVSCPAANGFVTPFLAASDGLTIRPGGLALLVARDATGYAVTAGTGDLFHFANSAGSTGVTYEIFIIGVATAA